jgi:hypothetical protein
MNFVIHRVSWVDIFSVANLLSVRGIVNLLHDSPEESS